LEGGGGLDLNSEAMAVPGLVNVNSQADNYIVGDFYSPTGSFPDLGQYQQFLHSVDVPARGRIWKATSASQPRRKNASGGATWASSAVAPPSTTHLCLLEQEGTVLRVVVVVLHVVAVVLLAREALVADPP
jgi:hypothetical protein